MTTEAHDARLRTWQQITATSLCVGYAGYYLGRSCLAIATPLMIDALGAQGMTKERIGVVASAGLVTYAIGKVVNGLVVDQFDGRRMFLFGMLATIVCTLAFGMVGTFAALIAIWSANRYFQSIGWNAVVKIASRWFAGQRRATIMGFVSISFLLGDAVIRFYLGTLVEIGENSQGTPLAILANWRSVFVISGATLGIIAIVTTILLRSSPSELGLEEPSANPDNVFGDAGQSAERAPLLALLAPLLQSPLFWSICGINFGMTIVRETFNNWSSTYLKEVGGLSSGRAGIASLVFPLVGAISALVAGWLSDRLGRRHGRVVLPALLLLIGSLGSMSLFDVQGRPIAAMILVGTTSFFLLGPYTYLSGVMALDLGGKRGSATASGLIDGAGYVGGIASGWGVAAIATSYGWKGVFAALAGVCCLTLIFALAYLIQSERGQSHRLVEFSPENPTELDK